MSDERIWWRGKQWKVTNHGIDTLNDGYFINADRVLEQIERYPWPRHMAEKIWVDLDEFVAAWLVAIVLHGYAGRVNAELLRKGIADARYERAVDERYERRTAPV